MLEPLFFSVGRYVLSVISLGHLKLDQDPLEMRSVKRNFISVFGLLAIIVPVLFIFMLINN